MAYTVPNAADAAFSAQAALDKVDLDAVTAAANLTGVTSGCAATVTGADMIVSIGAGQVLVAGMPVTVAAGNLTIGAANASNPRFDLIVVSSAGTKSVVAGTAGTNPVFPSIPANSVLLHAVYVPAADTSIQSNQIVDKRVTVRQPDEWATYLYF